MRRAPTFLALLALLGAAAPAHAQTRATGTVAGRVADIGGIALPSVEITVTGEALMGDQIAYCGSGGNFRLQLLPPGIYTLTFKLQGFANIVREGVEIGVGRTTTVNVRMELSSIEETITVSGRSPLVDIKTTKRSSEYSDELRNALPESRGVGGDLMSLAPEATPNGSSPSATGANFFGENSTAFTVDGVNVTDPGEGTQFPFYSPDWFDVVEITPLGGNAEYGKYQGANFNVVTKSGGNRFHGEGNFFYQDDAFIADNTRGINEDAAAQAWDEFEPPTLAYRYDGTFGIGIPTTA